MSDASYFTDLDGGTDNLEVIRSKFQTAAGASRFNTVKDDTASGAGGTLAADFDVVVADATAGAVTWDLPASPTEGDEYLLIKSDASANAVTAGRNGSNINGAAADKSTTTQHNGLRLIWTGIAAYGWHAEVVTGA